MLATVCDRHKTIVPVGERCAGCAQAGAARRAAANVRLGRVLPHWRRLSAIARRAAGGVCPGCGGREDPADEGSKLTVDLVGGGDHSRARLEQTRVACRRCHGHADGGRRIHS